MLAKYQYNRKTSIYYYVVALIILTFLATLIYHKVTYDDEDSNHISRHEEGTRESLKAEGTSLDSKCNIVHIAVVCGGYNSTRSLYVLLKSILFHRTNSVIHLHLFVDVISRQILSEIFNSWLVNNLSVKFYNLTEHEKEVTWITNPHYSHRYGLMKLVALSVLAKQRELDRVILIDTDMLVLGDIRHAWLKFDELTKIDDRGKKAVFGMVENQSVWYFGGNLKITWPAYGRGYNSGLILVDLGELRKIDWDDTWRQVAETWLVTHLTTTLADQDIFNAILASKNHLIYKLPCSFNLQLNDHSRLEDICPKSERNSLKIIHWNSPRKFDTKNPSSNYFKNWYINFRNWDAKMLESHYCDGKKLDHVETDFKSNDFLFSLQCDSLEPKPTDRLRIYPYFIDYEYEPTDWDVAYVVHLSVDRLQVLDQLAKHWQGPITVAIYLSELETELLLSSIQASDNLIQRKNIGYHLVFRDYGFNYPINRLRNIALNHTITPFVFLSDVDFIPPSNLYEYLKKSLAKLAADQNSATLAKTALVVPAFENSEYKFDFPESKEELKLRLSQGSISIFREKIWPQGQSATNYTRWNSSSASYEVTWNLDYEPFIVASHDVPKFDERFVGFGWNKVEHIMQLAAMKYKFIVLPEAFIIHKNHSASLDILKHRESIEYRSCIRYLKRTFLEDLRSKYPAFMRQSDWFGPNLSSRYHYVSRVSFIKPQK